MDFQFVVQADQAAFELERAKRALEAAKANLDSAKQAYDEIMSRAEEHGIPRARLKKLVDERVQALMEGGLADVAQAKPSAKSEKAPKKPSNKKAPSGESAAGSKAASREPAADKEDAANSDDPVVEVPLRPVPDIWEAPNEEAPSNA